MIENNYQQALQISLVDATGKVLLQETYQAQNKIKLNTASLPSGIYTIVCNNNNGGKYYYKVVK